MKEIYKQYENLEPEALLEKLSMGVPPFNPYSIAKLLNIEVSEELDWIKLAYDGEIYVDENKETKIWINQTNHINRKKFTVAHEIGHFINDVLSNYESFQPIFDDKNTLSFKRDGNRNFMEYRANDFAARLLMPKESVIIEGRKIIDQHFEMTKEKLGKDVLIKKLSTLFEVSEEAMKWRLINLNLIN
jgi:Zn-dependent peptidase ImmA (M78 family)